MGTVGEDIVYKWLTANNSLVQDMRYQTYSKGRGPRLEGTEGSIVLPDFSVWNRRPDKGNYAVDVKVKSSIYPINGKLCFTVDEKFDDYRRCVQIMKLDFLMLVFIYKGRMYSYKDTDTLGKHDFNSAYGKWGYIFAHDESKVVY